MLVVVKETVFCRLFSLVCVIYFGLGCAFWVGLLYEFVISWCAVFPFVFFVFIFFFNFCRMALVFFCVGWCCLVALLLVVW